jgi:hypothetical protein
MILLKTVSQLKVLVDLKAFRSNFIEMRFVPSQLLELSPLTLRKLLLYENKLKEFKFILKGVKNYELLFLLSNR